MLTTGAVVGLLLVDCPAGKLFYHITSTQAALEASDAADRERLRQALVMMLTALADRLQVWLDRLRPEKRQELRDEVELRRQQQARRQQDRLRAEAAAAAQDRTTSASGNVSAPPRASEMGSAPGLQAHNAADALVPSLGLVRGASSSSSRGRGSLGCSDDVLWWLKNYVIFHTSWPSPRSPPYNGELLEEVVVELFGFHPRARGD